VEATVKTQDPNDRGTTLATRTRLALGALAASLVLALAACGGAKNEEATPVSEIPASRNDAARFLTQASFGPTTADVDRVMAIGYGSWIDEQLARPRTSHRTYWEAQDAAFKAANPTNTSATIGQDGIYNTSGSRPSAARTSCGSASHSRCRRSSSSRCRTAVSPTTRVRWPTTWTCWPPRAWATTASCSKRCRCTR
jgi:hypothetical protein